MARTYNLTCEECKEPFAARGSRQRQCDPCWGKMMGAVRVEYLSRTRNETTIRSAIIVCRKCDTEYATHSKNQKRPGLCPSCSLAASYYMPGIRNKTCEECGEVYKARGVRQRQCDSCWGKMMGAVRVEYLPSGKSLGRSAIIICGECKNEYATCRKKQKYPGLCGPCSSSAANRGKKKSPEHRAKLAEAHRGKKMSPEARANMSASRRGRKAPPETRAKMRKANRDGRRRGIAQGGKYGWIYVVSGPGQVKVGASMNEKTLAERLAKHERNGLTEVHARWQIDPKHGSRIEATVVAAVLAAWDMVDTTVRPDGGTETVWCDDPAAIVALVESVISQEQ